jgi:metal-responsive CopG/Arc/MetJ family transcriptional regulator
MEEYKRFTVSLPEDLYRVFEKFRKHLSISRSEAIRKAMHQLMISEENILTSSGNVVGCITLIMTHEHFDVKHEHPNLENHSIEHSHHLEDDKNHYHNHDYSSTSIYANIQQTDEILKNDIHHFCDIIISTMHIHLEFEKCLEIIAVSGPFERVKKLKDDLHRLKSVISIGFFIIDKESTITDTK